MSVLKKLKDIFYDEIEEESEEIEKPVIRKVEKSKPIIEKKEEEKIEEKPIVREEPAMEPLQPRVVEPIKPTIPAEEEVKPKIAERDVYQSKQTFKFPILDDEEEVITRPIKKTRSGSSNIMDIERKQREVRKKEEEYTPSKPKQFKPSPVISPIFGIVDKDYDKSELIKTQMEKQPATRSEATSRDYDSIRRKAYGHTKEEAKKVIESVNDIERELNEVQGRNRVEDLMQNKHATVGELEEMTEIENISSVSTSEEIEDKTLEHDLFNLIDSMYEEEDK